MLFMYIDPGTGSMLLSLFVGIAAGVIFGLRAIFIKLQFVLSKGKTDRNVVNSSIPYVIFSDHKRYRNVFNVCSTTQVKQC